MIRACQTCTEGFFFDFSVFVYNDLNQTFTVCESQFAGLCKSALYTISDFDSVNYDFNCMLIRFFQLDFILTEHFHLIIDSYSGESFSHDSVQNLLMLSFAPSHHRCQNCKLRSFPLKYKHFNNLVYSLTCNFPAAYRTVGNPYTCIHQSQIIIYLSYSSYCRSGVFVGCLLINGNCR